MIYVLCVVFALSLALGQVVLKTVANQIVKSNESHFIWAFFSWQLFFAVSLYALTMLLWIFILTRLPLNVAYPFSLVGSALVIVMSYLVLGETMSSKQIVGLFVIVIGLVIANF